MYYVAAVFEADRVAYQMLGATSAGYIRGVYSGLLIIFLAIMIKYWPTSTSTGGSVKYPTKEEDKVIQMHLKK